MLNHVGFNIIDFTYCFFEIWVSKGGKYDTLWNLEILILKLGFFSRLSLYILNFFVQLLSITNRLFYIIQLGITFSDSQFDEYRFFLEFISIFQKFK